MQIVTGQSIVNRIAIGSVFFYHKPQKSAEASFHEAPAARLEKALEQAKQELTCLYERALAEVGEDQAAIFDVHRMMLEDNDFLDAIRDKIAGGQPSEAAVKAAGSEFSALFAAMDDDYMRARAADILDVSERIYNLLTGIRVGPVLKKPVILIADDLTPSETMQLDRQMVLGFVTRQGSTNSHTAILARTMNIPALIGVNIDESWDGKNAILDGRSQCLILDPTTEQLENSRQAQTADISRDELLKALKGQDNITKSGQKVQLFANIGSLADVDTVLENDAQGIGLFRSEFLYLEAKQLPTEEQQFSVYRRVAERMSGKKVIIRTLDIGADKEAPCLPLPQEENPALGYRAIRICLTQQDLFKTQLRAILRAAVYGRISIMFPMIISVEEVLQAKALLLQCQEELRNEGIATGEPEIGIMIETPAAVVLADELAQEVDFFSLGTNDLTQYTLAIDRQNPRLNPFYDPHHPAILRMIAHTVETGHRHGCWVGICGELGSDMTLTAQFLAMGVDELSVSPGKILPLRAHIRSLP